VPFRHSRRRRASSISRRAATSALAAWLSGERRSRMVSMPRLYPLWRESKLNGARSPTRSSAAVTLRRVEKARTPIAIPNNPADLVGGTPLVRMSRLAPDCGAELIGKLEAYNPAGSVKDRIGVAMVDAAEAEGRIEPGRTTIVEATSGNTGIALAFVAAARGYDLVLTMPQGMSRERENLLRLYGAKVDITESLGGMNEALDAASEMAAGNPDAWRPDQFSNPANPEIHRRTTAEEIWADLDGDVDVLVAGVGTGGTITGAGERLKERNPDLHVVAVEPKSSPVLSGGSPGPHKIQGIGAGFVPAVMNLEVVDEILLVDDEDAIETARRVSRREGVLAGISGGAALWGAIEVGSRPEFAGKRVVAIVPDSGERYVSLPFFAP
jgi:cysteine synthase